MTLRSSGARTKSGVGVSIINLPVEHVKRAAGSTHFRDVRGGSILFLNCRQRRAKEDGARILISSAATNTIVLKKP